MAKLTTKIALPVILIGVFAIGVFLLIDSGTLTKGFYVTIVFLTIGVFFFGLAMGQNLSSPVKKILKGAEELSKGNSSSRVYLETRDELAELAKTFNKIAEDLGASQTRRAEAEKEVGIKVKARTMELEEIIQALEQKVKNRTIELERLINESSELQEEAKGRGAEVAQLKRELADFRKKIIKTKKTS